MFALTTRLAQLATAGSNPLTGFSGITSQSRTSNEKFVATNERVIVSFQSFTSLPYSRQFATEVEESCQKGHDGYRLLSETATPHELSFTLSQSISLPSLVSPCILRRTRVIVSYKIIPNTWMPMDRRVLSYNRNAFLPLIIAWRWARYFFSFFFLEVDSHQRGDDDP